MASQTPQQFKHFHRPRHFNHLRNFRRSRHFKRCRPPHHSLSTTKLSKLSTLTSSLMCQVPTHTNPNTATTTRKQSKAKQSKAKQTSKSSPYTGCVYLGFKIRSHSRSLTVTHSHSQSLTVTHSHSQCVVTLLTVVNHHQQRRRRMTNDDSDDNDDR